MIDREQVAELYTMQDAFDAVEEAAIAWVEERTQVPQRAALHAEQSGLETLVMPGAVDGKYSGAKIWYASPGTERLPGTSALIVLIDPELGEVVLDGSVITDLRTGAMTGLAARYLALEDTSTATIIGAGIQARTQALALAHGLEQLREIHISSRRAEARARFVEELQAEMSEAYPQVRVVSSNDAQTSCELSQVIVAATTAREPVIPDEWVQPGAFVCGVGSHDPQAAEIDPRTVERAALAVVDTRRGAIDGAGDISSVIESGRITRDDVVELGELLKATADYAALRTQSDRNPVVFKTVGFAAADLVSAHRVAAVSVTSGRMSRREIH